MSLLLGFVHDAAGLSLNLHLLGVHFVLGQILHFNAVEVSQGTMQGDESKLHAPYFHTFHHFAREVQARGGSGDGSFVLGENALEISHVVFCCRAFVHDVVGQGSRS